MIYRFEKLNVWIEARLFIKKIYLEVSKFPLKEQFSLSDQIKRAAISIGLNIAEGSSKNSDKDFSRFLRISQGSITEVVAGLFIAKDLGYIEESSFDELYNNTHKLAAMINALIRKLNENK